MVKLSVNDNYFFLPKLTSLLKIKSILDTFKSKLDAYFIFKSAYWLYKRLERFYVKKKSL